jgi:hypothetical protein
LFGENVASAQLRATDRQPIAGGWTLRITGDERFGPGPRAGFRSTSQRSGVLLVLVDGAERVRVLDQ